MKSLQIKIMLLAAFIGLFVGVGVAYIGNKSLDEQYHRQNKEIAEISDKLWEKELENEEDAANPNYINNAQFWTGAIKSMPKTQARTDMANSILKAIEDNVITADENKMLSTQFDQLENTNLNQITKENATKIRDGEDITNNTDQKKALSETLNDEVGEMLYENMRSLSNIHY